MNGRYKKHTHKHTLKGKINVMKPIFLHIYFLFVVSYHRRSPNPKDSCFLVIFLVFLFLGSHDRRQGDDND